MTTEGSRSSAAPHDASVAYLEEVLPAASVNAAVWNGWSYTDGSVTCYYVQGPCPRCLAQSQGKATESTPLESQGEGDAAGAATEETVVATETVEVPVHCACGYTHGKDGATNCGRSWTVVLGWS